MITRLDAGPAAATGLPTRVAALVAAGAALACVGVSGGLSPALVPVAVAAMTLTDLLTTSRGPRVDRVLRHRVMPVALLVCAGPALLALSRAGGDPTLVRAAGARLAAGALVVMPLAGSARRDLLARLALATATAGLATTGAGSRIALPGLVFLVAALTLLALLERDRLAGRLAAGRASAPPGPRPLLPAALAVLLAAAVAVPVTALLHLPAPPHPAGGSGSRGIGQVTGDRLDPAAGSIDLRQRGALSPRPVAHVSASEPLLWRTGYLTDYDGRTWRAAGPDGPAGTAAPVSAAGPRRTDTVTPLGSTADGDGGLLLSPGQPVGSDPAPDAAYEGGSYAMPDTTYSVTSVVAAVPAGDRTPVAEATGSASTGWASTGSASTASVPPSSLSLPALPSRVVALAHSLTDGSPDREAAVDAVVRYLHQNDRYRLDSPVPPRGADAVDDFLFRSREGFCEQFASAAAVLLRVVGVPTRLAVGYADGVPDGSGRLLKGTDAHAWIEVWFPTAGWVAVDPTAGAVGADSGSSWWYRAWDRLRVSGTDVAALALVGVVVGVAVALGVLGVRRRRRERGLDPLERALRRLDRRMGAGHRRRDETLREFAERLPYDDAVRAAVLVAEEGRYAAGAQDPERRRRAARVLRRPRRARSRTTVGSAGRR